MFPIVSFQSSGFLHTEPCTQLSVIVAKFYPFVYHSALCSHFEVQLWFVMKPEYGRPKVGSRLSNTQYLSNEMIKEICMCCKTTRENQGKISRILLKI